jgi:iron complex transport system substrate-binding protein
MRIVSHTCSNTEIVCALGCADFLVGVDEDSDYPVEVVATLPKLGRDLSLDIAAVTALKPDLVLTSLTLPGHEKIVAALEAAGLRTLVCGPLSLADVYSDIRRIAVALNVSERGEQLVHDMQAAMPPVSPAYRPRIHVEWWPKPVIVPAKESWVTDVIHLAGGINPYAAQAVKSVQVSPAMAQELQPDAIVMSWCGVEEKNYRAEVVLRREDWNGVHAIQRANVVPITEAFLGRPGPRLVDGYRALRKIVESFRPD